LLDAVAYLLAELLDMAVGPRRPRSALARGFLVLAVLAIAAMAFVVWKNWGLLTASITSN